MNNEEDIKYETTGEYTKLRITANTLVRRGAVMERGIYKSKDGFIKSKINNVVCKSDDEKMQLHSICYMLNKKDSHGNFCSNPKVLEDAIGDWMLNGSKIIKHTHEGGEIDAYVQQLYLVPKGHPIWKEDKYVGAIANVIQFNDAELYKYYKEHEFETSIEGFAEEEQVPVEKSNMFKKMYELIISKLKSEGSIIMKKEDVKESEVKKEEGVVTDTKPEDVKEPEVKKELAQEVIDYVTGIVNELTAKYDAKYDELKGMISNLVPNTEIESVKEVIKEIKKDITLSRESSTIDVKSNKTSLLS